MFDGPLPREFAKPARPWGSGVGLFTILLAVIVLTIAFGGQPGINGPSPMRQIEVLRGPGAVSVYLHNAGYRLLHKRRLIAVVPGNGPVTADWVGPDVVRLHVPPDSGARVTPVSGLQVILAR
jgi:hypothetical protein